MHLIEFKHGAMRHERLDRIEDGVDRSVAGRLMGGVNAVDIESQRRRLRALGAGEDSEVDELDALMRVYDLVVDEGDQILVIDDLLSVGENP